MKHDFKKIAEGTEADHYCEWLASETTQSLKDSYGNAEATKSAIFLFANRTFEANMPEKQIAELFAKAVVSAGYSEQEEEAIFAWLDHFGQIARGVHSGT